MVIGREKELRTIAAALESSRLVTLTGPGGVGKTTLAKVVCSARSDDDVVFADLAPLDAEDLAEGIAGGAGFSSFADMVTSIEGRETLVVLDNCEHVIDAAAAIVEELTAATSDSLILATSRAMLDVPGERVIRIAPLSTDGSPSPAVRLFLEVAHQRGVPMPDGANVADLCRRLDGLPLAIELAAARVSAMTATEIAAELDTRLDLLTRSRPRGPARHRSLAAAIAWSYQLLAPDVRRMFARLAVLPAAFTAEMAAAVGGEKVADTQLALVALVDGSLLVHEPADGVSWYRMLETIRSFAGEQLDDSGERTPVGNRLLDHLAGVVDALSARGVACDFGVASDLRRLYRHVHWAIDAALDRDDAATAARLVSPLWWLEDVGHQGEAADLIERMLRRWPEHPQAGLWWGIAAALLRIAGRHEASRRAAELAVDQGGLGAAYGHRTLGQDARRAGSWNSAFAHFAAGAEEARRAGHDGLAIEIEMHATLTRARAGEVHAALGDSERLIAASEEYPLVQAWARDFHAYMSANSDPARTKRLARDLLVVGQNRDAWLVASSHVNLAIVALLDGDPHGAARHLAAAIETYIAIRNRNDVTLALLFAAACFVRLDDEPTAQAVLATEHRYTASAMGPFEAQLLERTGPLPDMPGAAWLELDEIVRRLRAAATVRADSPPEAISNHFRRRGDSWELAYDGVAVHLAHRKGFDDLAALLAQPGREIAALDLMGAHVVAGDAGPASDQEARRRYTERVRELQDQLDDATAMGDIGRAERAQAELDSLVDHLAASYGIGGRDRSQGRPAEKARSAVTWRIRAAIRHITDAHPALGAHLDRSVSTGRFCVYDPLPPQIWEL